MLHKNGGGGLIIITSSFNSIVVITNITSSFNSIIVASGGREAMHINDIEDDSKTAGVLFDGRQRIE
jgi:hypothetical protein